MKKREVIQPDPVSVMSRFITTGEEMKRLDDAFRLSPTRDNALRAIQAWQEFVKAREAICGYELPPMFGCELAS